MANLGTHAPPCKKIETPAFISLMTKLVVINDKKIVENQRIFVIIRNRLYYILYISLLCFYIYL